MYVQRLWKWLCVPHCACVYLAMHESGKWLCVSAKPIAKPMRGVSRSDSRVTCRCLRRRPWAPEFYIRPVFRCPDRLRVCRSLRSILRRGHWWAGLLDRLRGRRGCLDRSCHRPRALVACCRLRRLNRRPCSNNRSFWWQGSRRGDLLKWYLHCQMHL